MFPISPIKAEHQGSRQECSLFARRECDGADEGWFAPSHCACRVAYSYEYNKSVANTLTSIAPIGLTSPNICCISI